MEEEKEKICIVVLSAYARNEDLANLHLAMEVIQYMKGDGKNLSFIIAPRSIMEYIPDEIKLGMVIEFLEKYHGKISIYAEMDDARSKIKEQGFQGYVLIAQRDLALIFKKKFMDNYGIEMMGLIAISCYGGLRLKKFILIGKIKEFFANSWSMIRYRHKKKQNLLNVPI